MPIAARIVDEAGRRHRAIIERQPQLLGNLTAQGKARIFAGFDLSSGELPQSSVRLSGLRLLQQQPFVTIANDGSDDQQRCRIIFQTVPTLEPFLNADLRQPFTGTMIGGSEAMKLLSIFQGIVADNRGATAIEYGLILAMVFLAMVGALEAFGGEVTTIFNDVSSTSVSAMQG